MMIFSKKFGKIVTKLKYLSLHNHLMEIKAIYDLSVTLKTYMPIWPTNPLVDVKPLGTVVKDGYKVETYFSATHSGTHIDKIGRAHV